MFAAPMTFAAAPIAATGIGLPIAGVMLEELLLLAFSLPATVGGE